MKEYIKLTEVTFQKVNGKLNFVKQKRNICTGDIIGYKPCMNHLEYYASSTLILRGSGYSYEVSVVENCEEIKKYLNN